VILEAKCKRSGIFNSIQDTKSKVLILGKEAKDSQLVALGYVTGLN
jgi:hypothetical protein